METNAAPDTDPTHPRASRPGASGPLPLRIACGLLVAAGCLLVATYGVAPQFVERTAEHLLASDGSLSDSARGRLPEIVHVGAASCVLWGLLALGWMRSVPGGRLRRMVREDPLGSSPERVLPVTTILGFAMLLLFEVNRRVDVGWMQAMFRKEGVLEQLTALLYLASSVVLALAAVRLRTRLRAAGRDLVAAPPHMRAMTLWLPIGVACLAFVFFVVGGEEISWGQSFLGYETPASYSAINKQHETNVHNLLTKEQLDAGTILAAVTAFVILMACWVATAVTRSPWLEIVVPHPSLMPLAYLTFLIASWTHLEIMEVMSAFFVSFYTWRLFRGRVDAVFGVRSAAADAAFAGATGMAGMAVDSPERADPAGSRAHRHPSGTIPGPKL